MEAIESLSTGEFAPLYSLLVFQDGELLLEQYWSGEDLVYGQKKHRDFGPKCQ